ncbi:unnamed protein product [Lymnaea stagnalis]|uniref:RRM domain-containing protein n=1 Tax=Lymnaea stagnalis TaxID=6523 RepID=A0AAV2HL99_LYMST
MSSSLAKMKASEKSEAVTVHNGNAKHLESSNGTSAVSITDGAKSTGRKDRRKEWWDKKKKPEKKIVQKTKSDTEREGQHRNVEVDVLTAGSGDGVQTEQRTKLRNRETIAKPDSLKYEPDFNRGFHSKIMQNLYTDTSKKKRKKNSRQETQKRKSMSASNDEQESGKKLKPGEESEVLDLYKFSLNLINGDVDTSKSATSKDSKNKYVLFIGNLPFDITREQLEDHFRKTGGIKSIRIPRDKGTEKGRGFAYMEFDGRISHGIALRLHQTTLGGRKINVEFTSIGGGKSEARKEKLKQKNHKRRRMKMQ